VDTTEKQGRTTARQVTGKAWHGLAMEKPCRTGRNVFRPDSIFLGNPDVTLFLNCGMVPLSDAIRGLPGGL
jgi:hypothetical protein